MSFVAEAQRSCGRSRVRAALRSRNHQRVLQRRNERASWPQPGCYPFQEKREVGDEVQGQAAGDQLDAGTRQSDMLGKRLVNRTGSNTLLDGIIAGH
jgi:hypothetical protein